MLIFVLIAVVIVVVRLLLERNIASKQQPYWVMGLAFVSIFIAAGLDLSFSNMGLTVGSDPRSIVLVVASVIATVLVLLASYRLSLIHRLFESLVDRQAGKGSILYEVGFRIPFVTVLPEEIIFRGIILGGLLQFIPSAQALIVSSLFFSIWHLPEYINSIKQVSMQMAKEVLPVLLATFIAGLVFGTIRLWTGSIALVFLLHWSFNSVGYVFARSLSRKK